MDVVSEEGAIERRRTGELKMCGMKNEGRVISALLNFFQGIV